MKSLIKSALLLIMLLLVVVNVNCLPSSRNENLGKTATDNDLPSILVTFTNGTQTSTKDFKGKLAIILFQPDCDHCQREAQDILNNLTSFKDYKLYFISSAPLSEIEKFSVDYQLKGKPNVFFGHTASENIINSYGSIPAPSLYLYNEARLIQSFNGEVAIEVVIKYLEQ